MTITLAGVRQALAARVALLSGWVEAPVAFDAFSWDAVPEAMAATTAHKAFAVGVADMVATGERHKTHFRARTTAVIRSLHRLLPAAAGPIASVDAALTAELLLIQQLDQQWTSGGSPVEVVAYFNRSRRSTAPTGEWLLIETEFFVDHLVNLS